MIYDFDYFAPTHVVFGKGLETRVGELTKAQGAKKVLLLFGGNSAKKSGLLDKVKTSLKENDIAFVELGGVVPNPRLSKVYEGIKICKENGVDFLLAVGGGSVIDSCKAIGYGLYNDGDVWDFYIGKRKPQGCFPVGVVLTISAAGSEMSNSSVITNDIGQLKKSCNTDFARCKFVIENPELTCTVPKYQTMCGCTDIMMHTIERYFAKDCGQMILTDQIAEGLLRTVRQCAYTLLDDAKNYDARAMVMWAAGLSHNNLTACGNPFRGDWSCHQIEHELGGLFDVAHGAGLSAIWGSWARYVYHENPLRFAQFGREVFGMATSNNPIIDAEHAIQANEQFYHDINMPTNLYELGIKPSEKEIELMSNKCTGNGSRTIGSFKVLDTQDVIQILTMANKF